MGLWCYYSAVRGPIVVIVAGGGVWENFLPLIKTGDIYIGADRGALWLLDHSITPGYAVGDFDSVSKGEYERIKESSPNVAQYENEKDETDLEIAMKLAVSLQPRQILIFGGTGSRFDQMLAGFYLLEKFKSIDITFFDEHNEVSLIASKKIIEKNKRFLYCSFLSLASRSIISLQGFKYPLSHNVLKRNQSLGVSNELVSKKGIVTIHRGSVLFIRSRD